MKQNLFTLFPIAHNFFYELSRCIVVFYSSCSNNVMNGNGEFLPTNYRKHNVTMSIGKK